MRHWRSLLGMALLLAVPAAGSTFLHVSRAELSAKAQAVVVGEVVEVRSFWHESGRIIVTDATVAVEQAVVGQSPALTTVRTFGGTVDGFTVEAHGFPKFELGQRLLLFLEPDGRAKEVRRVLGYQEGMYRVVIDDSGAEIAVPTVDAGAHLLTAQGRPAPAPRPIALDDLRNDIRAAARRAGRTDF